MRVISLISRNTQCLCLISRHFRHLFVRQGLTWRQLKYRKPGSGRGLWNGQSNMPVIYPLIFVKKSPESVYTMCYV